MAPACSQDSCLDGTAGQAFCRPVQSSNQLFSWCSKWKSKEPNRNDCNTHTYIYNIHTHIEHIHHTFIVWTWRHVHNSLFRWAPYLKAISFQTLWWKPRSKSNQLPNHGSNFCGCHGYISLCARISNRSIKLLGRYRLLDVSFWCVHSNAQNLSSRNARWSRFGGSNYFKLPQKKICALPSASELQKSLPALLIIPGPCSSLVMLLPLEGIRYYCCVKLNSNVRTS